jgi:hypothetical protein
LKTDEIHLLLGEQAGDLDWVYNVRFARLAELAAVALPSKLEGTPERGHVFFGTGLPEDRFETVVELLNGVWFRRRGGGKTRGSVTGCGGHELYYQFNRQLPVGSCQLPATLLHAETVKVRRERSGTLRVGTSGS